MTFNKVQDTRPVPNPVSGGRRVDSVCLAARTVHTHAGPQHVWRSCGERKKTRGEQGTGAHLPHPHFVVYAALLLVVLRGTGLLALALDHHGHHRRVYVRDDVDPKGVGLLPIVCLLWCHGHGSTFAHHRQRGVSGVCRDAGRHRAAKHRQCRAKASRQPSSRKHTQPSKGGVGGEGEGEGERHAKESNAEEDESPRGISLRTQTWRRDPSGRAAPSRWRCGSVR